jgi:DNA polymerase III delta prime subunit
VGLEYQIGRQRDIEMVRKGLGHGEDMILVDLRRTGKTTVALCALELVAAGRNIVFSVDLAEGAPSSVDVAERLAVQLTGHRPRWAPAVAGARSALAWLHERGRGALALLDDDVQAALEVVLETIRQDRPDGAAQIAAVLDEIEQLAAERDCFAVVFLDEIQAITDLPDGQAVQAELKARLRRGSTRTRFLFAGSEPSLVERLFRRGGVLDFQGIEHPLSAISTPAWKEGLEHAFGLLGCRIQERAIEEMLDASAGQALRTMLAARETHALAEMEKGPPVATYGVAVAGVDRARRSNLWKAHELE